MSLRMVLRAPFDVYSGYGNDAIDIALFAEKAGVDVLPWPTSILPGLPEKFAKMLMKDPSGQKDVVLTFSPPFDVKPWEFDRMAPKAVGWSMWERTPMLPSDFDGHGWDPDVRPELDREARLVQKRAWKGLDRMLVTCPMNIDAFRNVDEVTPLSVLPCGIDPDKWPVEARPRDRQMTFLMVGMLNGRKNPFAFLDAWRTLKARDPRFNARLHLHTLAPGLHPKIAEGAYGPDITITNRPLTHQELTGLYLSADVLVSTSRGEGNNKPAMEFMATGGTVLAPRWGGHENWMHRDVTYEIPYTPGPGEVPGTEDAHVDPDGLVEALRTCWEDREGVSRKGLVASRWIRESLGWPVVIRRLVSTLNEVCYG